MPLDGNQLRLLVLSEGGDVAWEVPMRLSLRRYERRREVQRRRAYEEGAAK